MRIKMITTAAGPDFSAKPGEVLTVSNERGAAWVALGYAIAMDPPAPEPAPAAPVIETAAMEAPEKAVQPEPVKKKAAGKKAAPHG